jgi:hypothetical protein
MPPAVCIETVISFEVASGHEWRARDTGICSPSIHGCMLIVDHRRRQLDTARSDSTAAIVNAHSAKLNRTFVQSTVWFCLPVTCDVAWNRSPVSTVN